MASASRSRTQLGGALEKQRVAIAQPGERSDYTLRGYMVAAKEKSGTKVSYIWDVTDPAGKRINRIQGEEMATGGDGRDPWSAVSPQITQTISDKTASSLAASLASLTPPQQTSVPVGVGAPADQGTAPCRRRRCRSRPAAAPTTGARTGQPIVTVANVTGAKGDGNTALTEAMRQELQGQGLSLVGAGQRSYTVGAKVTMGQVKAGREAIKIDWQVVDPEGRVLATVTQNNDIEAGALDKQWGGIANDAAQGAGIKIKTLIDESHAGVTPLRASTPVTRQKTATKPKA